MSRITPKAAKELYRILLCLKDEYIKKIPSSELEYINKRKDDNYITKINGPKDINSDNMMEETKQYLAYIFLNYLSSEEEREEYEIILRNNEIRYQKELEEIYDVSKMFNQYDNNKEKDEVNNKIDFEKKEITVMKNKNIFETFLDKIKKMFKV